MQIGDFPPCKDLKIGALSGIFGNVTNSYKFYWLLAILDGIQERRAKTLPIEWLLCRMVGLVWFPVHYFRLHFGKSDKLSEIAIMVMKECSLPMDASVSAVSTACHALPENSSARKLLAERRRYVPFRFIRPFFESETRGLADHQVSNRIAELASESFESTSPSMYRVNGDNLELAEAWFDYLTEHLEVIRGFCNWNLVLYLQSKNPTVGNISGKLNAPEERDLRAAKIFWGIALKGTGTHKCIFSGRDVPIVGFSLDHFLPWSFVAHDALWNICPTIPDVNSAKGDRLPSLDHYLSAFVDLQFDAVQRVAASGKDESVLEDYSLLFGTASKTELVAIPRDRFQMDLENVIRPQIQIATNCGFPPGWKYSA